MIGPVGLERADVVALYKRYLTLCNEHRFDQLGAFVDERVSGSGSVDGLAAYIERMKAVGIGFPDYHWELQGLIVEANTIAARLIGRGTHTGVFHGIAPTGREMRMAKAWWGVQRRSPITTKYLGWGARSL